ncbi:aspartyl-phosphate phosphatase Spo0E family protein [Cytobacillus sp. Sa5YUA1]|uniref:Aspartyl-phosphate phosphatase Spo0E family protein n=1 Tax=Cytobacillus stercorigallinarum TaxID=2762240 RepID=A0ABR8QM80_9BACI|nr:aspartyl-phosphate phosphatase Spo0E family protein [Cytobacillus stercorigallinarum]
MVRTKSQRSFRCVNKQELLLLIEQKRRELIQTAMRNGLNSASAIKYSQELDSLLNEYNRLYESRLTLNRQA